MRLVDLHTHSSASDGELAPSALIEKAHALGLSTLALTDHDTVDGIAEARDAAARAGIELIPGIEIEIDFEPGEFHLLGYGIDDHAPALVNATERLARARHERNAAILRRIAAAGLPLDTEKIAELSRTSYIGRPHLADMLVEARCARSRQDAFDKYLGKGRPFYIKKSCLPLEEALSVIRAAGGIPVVAHPYSLFVSKAMLGELFSRWKEMGIVASRRIIPQPSMDNVRFWSAWPRAEHVCDCRFRLSREGETRVRNGAHCGKHADRRAFP